MTPDALDLVRNLYAATGGGVPGPAWTALVATLVWMAAYDDGAEAGARAFEDVFAERLGWNEAQFDKFWNDPANEFGPEGARRFDESYDALDWMTKNRN